MVQQIVVIIIGIAVAAYIGWRTYRLLRGKKRGGSACAGCSADCALRDWKKPS